MANSIVDSVSRVKTEKSLIKHVIVDSGAFLRNIKLEDIGENIYTIPEVVNEIKDKATKQRLQVLPYELRYRTPSADDILLITEFSKKTGDYSSLSATDIKVLALSYLIHKEQIGTDNLRKEPLKGSQVISNSYVKELSKSVVGFYVPKEEKESKLEEKLKKLEIGNDEDYENDLLSSEDSDNDHDMWITPENLEEARRKMGALDTLPGDISVACLTTDFAMQNVLIQIGLRIISLEGLLIKQARTFILRCFACFNTTSIMTKQFCPKCGNKTLKRVAVSISEDGVKTVHLNFRRPLNIRGTRYSLPMPKGGKHAVNPILCEDQNIPHNRPNKMGKEVVDIFDPSFEVRNSPFALNDIYSRAGKLGIRNKVTTHRKTNPNSSGKRTGNKSSRKKPIL